VPGHRDFIENMLAGVGGIDAVLFVVAADEGVMPQTREHLSILDVLQVEAGVIALTKTDMVDDPEWLDLVEADVQAAVQGTVLGGAPIVRVSARTGHGVPDLVRALQDCLAGRAPRPNLGRPRLPVDRVFTIAGFGTVVTGTLLDGIFRLGEEVEMLPGGLRGRIRGLQSHKRKEQSALPGSRTAMNISGLDVDQIWRGQVVAAPGKYRPTRLVDVRFRLLPDVSAPVRHSSEVKFFAGAAEIVARVRLLGVEEIRPGQEGWLQLELRDPAVVVRGDHYILRRPSPAETLGGGLVIDPHPARRHRRFDDAVLARLESLHNGAPADVLLQALQGPTPLTIREAVTRARLSDEQAGEGLRELLETGQLVLLEPGAPEAGSDLLAWGLSRWSESTARAVHELENYHRTFPLRRGMPREALKSRLKMTLARHFNAAVRRWATDGVLDELGSLVWQTGFEVQFDPRQKAAAAGLLEKFAQSPFSPPPAREAQAEVGEDLFAALVEMGELVQVSGEVVFRPQDYDQMLELVRAHFVREETLTAAQLRDMLNTSRRYVLAFLEHLDVRGVTIREGDARRLREPLRNR
jgi:selenocysteine-specific elongation factor